MQNDDVQNEGIKSNADMPAVENETSSDDVILPQPSSVRAEEGIRAQPVAEKKQQVKPRAGVADFLAGEAKRFSGDLSPYLPQELIGGAVPYIPGTEDEAVWNAASQACGTENINYCYTVDQKKVWYLACPSASLASNPNSWCPLAAALPGNSEYWDRETVYLYESEGMASALRWDPETARMHVFLGASRTILPRVQSMDANFVTVNAELATVVPWKNRRLHTEKLSRAMVRVLILSGLAVCVVMGAILFLSFVNVNLMKRDLDTIKAQSDDAAMDLMLKASNVMQSDSIKHMVRIQELLDKLAEVDGTLVKYQVDGEKVEWEALIAPAFSNDFGEAMGLEKDGRVRVKNTK